jgi:hypothetical protein
MEVSTDPTIETMNMYNYINNFLVNPVVYIILLLILVAYFIFFYSLGNKSTEYSSSSSSNSGSFATIFVIVLVVILLFVNGLTYFFGLNLFAYITGLFSGNPVVNIVVDKTNVSPSSTTASAVPEIPFVEEVFNIPGNYYSYQDSKALCDAYGAKLATYDQIEKAYNNGGEWCNYGWSEDQMVLYPTQKSTFNKLQKVPGHEHDCGRPGVNGGYIANPEVKFGVNCFGNKPVITKEEKELMENSRLYPQTAQDALLEKRVDYWKEHVDEILISPFNPQSWSKI